MYLSHLPTLTCIQTPRNYSGGYINHHLLETWRAMFTYYLGSSYGGTVTSDPHPHPSPPLSWKREYRSSIFNRNNGCSQMYKKEGSKSIRVQRTWAPPSTASQAHYGDPNGLRRDLFPLALPFSGESLCTEARGNGNWGEGVTAASHSS